MTWIDGKQGSAGCEEGLLDRGASLYQVSMRVDGVIGHIEAEIVQQYELPAVPDRTRPIERRHQFILADQLTDRSPPQFGVVGGGQ
jgi:hypothetical protein